MTVPCESVNFNSTIFHSRCWKNTPSAACDAPQHMTLFHLTHRILTPASWQLTTAFTLSPYPSHPGFHPSTASYSQLGSRVSPAPARLCIICIYCFIFFHLCRSEHSWYSGFHSCSFSFVYNSILGISYFSFISVFCHVLVSIYDVNVSTPAHRRLCITPY